MNFRSHSKHISNSTFPNIGYIKKLCQFDEIKVREKRGKLEYFPRINEKQSKI